MPHGGVDSGVWKIYPLKKIQVLKEQNQTVLNDNGLTEAWHKTTVGYRFLYKYARFAFNLFYPVIHIEGRANIPEGKPVILAANHQNALMDALAMLFASNKPVYFLARADIFKKNRVAKILKFLQMMPVYRLRDEVDIVKKNETTFKQTADLLSAENYLGILPEGTHTPIKQLQTLKKGVCRIAFETVTQADENIDLHIVPVGLDYSDYHTQGSSLVVIFGKPIPVADFMGEYHENPSRAITLLRDKIADSMKEVMINIDNTEQYQFIHRTSEQIADNNLAIQVINEPREWVWQRYNLIKHESERLLSLLKHNPVEYNEFKASRLSEQSEESTAGSGYEHFGAIRPRWKVLIFKIITVLALLLNIAPFVLAGWLSNRVKDKQFISSFKFVISLILFPLWYLLLFLIIATTAGVMPALGIVSISIFLAILKLKYVR